MVMMVAIMMVEVVMMYKEKEEEVEEDTSPFFMDCSPDTYCRDWPFNILLVRPTVCTSRPLHARMVEVVVYACPSTVLTEDNHCFIKRQFLAEKFFGFSLGLEWHGEVPSG